MPGEINNIHDKFFKSIMKDRQTVWSIKASRTNFPPFNFWPI